MKAERIAFVEPIYDLENKLVHIGFFFADGSNVVADLPMTYKQAESFARDIIKYMNARKVIATP